MTPQESQSLPPPGSTPDLPVGATAIATALTVGGIALIVYWWRVRTLRRHGMISAPTSPAQPPQAVMELSRDMEDLAERLASEMDRRADRLELLIARADERIAALDNAQSRTFELKPVAKKSAPANPAFGEVYDLADRGLSPVEIARQLGRPTGQVELILNLRRGNIAL